MVRKSVAVTEDYESSVTETFPLPLELGSVCPEEFEDLEFATTFLASSSTLSSSHRRTGGIANLHRLLASRKPAQSHIPYALEIGGQQFWPRDDDTGR